MCLIQCFREIERTAARPFRAAVVTLLEALTARTSLQQVLCSEAPASRGPPGRLSQRVHVFEDLMTRAPIWGGILAGIGEGRIMKTGFSYGLNVAAPLRRATQKVFDCELESWSAQSQ